MNHILLTIGLAIIAIAAAAIAAPFIVDWSAQRDFFETQASRILGQPVSIDGDIAVRFLPEPSFRFADLTIGEADANGEGAIALAALNVKLAPGALLKAQAEITAAEIVAPSFAVRVGEDGTVRLPSLFRGKSFDPSRVSAESVQIREGRITVIDAAETREWTIAQISGDAVIRTLDGPYRFDGGYILDGVRYGVRFSTGRVGPDGLPINLALESGSRPLSITLDGAARFKDSIPSFEGGAEITHGLVVDGEVQAGPVWHLTASVNIDPEQVNVGESVLAFGPSDREIKFTGTGELPLKGEGNAVVNLAGRQIDLDRYMGGTPDNPVRPAAALALATGLARNLSGDLGIDRRIDLDTTVSALVLGGDILQNVSATAEIGDGSLDFEALSAVFPGNANLAFSGKASGFAEDATLKGRLTVSALNIVPAIRWVSESAAAALKDAEQVIAGLSMEADATVGTDTVDLSNITGKLRESPFEGTFAFTRATHDAPGEIRLGVSARLLDLPPVDLAALNPVSLRESAGGDSAWAWLGRYLLDVNVAVDNLFVGETGAGGVVADLTVSDGDVDIRNLKIRELLGAEIAASGHVTGWPKDPDGSLAVEVKAQDLTEIAPILAKLGWVPPGSGIAGSENLALFEPASLSANVAAGLSDTGARLTIKGKGALADTKVGIDADLETLDDAGKERYLALDFDIANPSSRALLAQFGLEARDAGLPDAIDVPASTSVLLRGVPSDSLETVVDASLLGGVASLVGTSTLDTDGHVTVELDAQLTAADVSALAGFAGLPVPEETTEANLRAQISGRPMRPKIDGIDGTLGDAGLSGELAFGGSDEQLSITGRMTTDKADLDWLMGTAFAEGLAGTGAITSEGAWPQQPIIASPFSGIDLDIAAKSGRLSFTDTVALANAEYRLKTRDGAISIDPIKGLLFGTPATGAIDLKPDVGGVAFTGRVRLDDGDLAAFSKLVSDASPADGRFSLNLQATGQGRSPQALVASLTGQGRYSLTNAVIRRLSPNAFPLVMRAAEAGLDLDDAEVGRVFASHLDGGPLSVPQAEGVFSVAGGVARVSNAILDGDRAKVRVSGSYDLGDGAVNTTLTLSPQDRTDGLEPQTEVLVNLAGPIDAPERTIDVSALTGFLSVRKFEREVQRIEILQADILERQRMARQMIVRRQMLARLEAEDAARAEAERLRLEAEEAAAAAAASAKPEAQTDAPAADAPAAPAPETVPTPQPPRRESRADPAAPPRSDASFAEKIRSALSRGQTSRTTREPAGLDAPLQLAPNAISTQ
ncbi:MAG: AsmA family protein [Rhodobiaceae bacterium]|nr:AsmA family protein [Rhodobiaceae bacterium]